MKILWNISSHGWGHAARQRELIRVFKLKYPNTFVMVASDVPEWFWKRSDVDSVLKGSPSPIVVEKRGDIDLKATRAHLLNFILNSDRFLKAEVERQQLLKADLVISDIDPLPVLAAEVNDIPALGISNFTWDWIMSELLPDLKNEIKLITKMYKHGTYLKLPMGPDHTPFNKTIDVPILRGGPPGKAERVRNLLPGGKVCLIALREIPPAITLSVPENFTALSSLPSKIHPVCHNITPKELTAAGATFADLIAASDVIVSKPGYGIISQIITMGKKAVLFTGRKFPEEKYLLTSLQERAGIKLIPINSSNSLQSSIRNLSDPQGSFSMDSCDESTITDLIYSIF